MSTSILNCDVALPRRILLIEATSQFTAFGCGVWHSLQLMQLQRDIRQEPFQLICEETFQLDLVAESRLPS
jgi:hypothetical protein